jgi:hypothetical protein
MLFSPVDLSSRGSFALFATSDRQLLHCEQLDEGRILAGVVDCAARAGTGANKTRELAGSYDCNWRDYRLEGGRYGEFRYVPVRV